MFLALSTVILTQMWASRVDNEFTDFDLKGDSVAFGTFSSFGQIELEAGKRRWAVPLKEGQLGTRIATDGKTTIVSIGNGPIAAFDAKTGKPKWSIGHKGYSSPVLVDAGFAYLETEPNKIAAIDLATHKPIWTVDGEHAYNATDSQLSVKPVIMGTHLLIGLRTGSIACLNPLTGAQEWTLNLSDSPVQAILFDDERVYIANARGGIYAVGRDTGSPLWSHDARNAIAGSPLIQDGKLVVVSAGGFVLWLNALNGQELWTQSFSKEEDFSVTAPVADGSGIFFMRRSGGIHLDEFGNQNWTLSFSSAASFRTPIKYKTDYILFDAHATYRARPQ